jgi:hypothetical protein
MNVEWLGLFVMGVMFGLTGIVMALRFAWAGGSAGAAFGMLPVFYGGFMIAMLSSSWIWS